MEGELWFLDGLSGEVKANLTGETTVGGIGERVGVAESVERMFGRVVPRSTSPSVKPFCDVWAQWVSEWRL